MRSWSAGLLLITVLGCASDEGAGPTAAPPRPSELNPMIALNHMWQTWLAGLLASWLTDWL
ncbi:MAG TPA: hypothetical protein EYQ83_13995, partial [Acidobacteria bacterium]|nr:hypothetical protein [Acidobacteriota bacterium]